MPAQRNVCSTSCRCVSDTQMIETFAARRMPALRRKRRPRFDPGRSLSCSHRCNCAFGNRSRACASARASRITTTCSAVARGCTGRYRSQALARLCCITQALNESAIRMTLASVPCTARSANERVSYGSGLTVSRNTMRLMAVPRPPVPQAIPAAAAWHPACPRRARAR